MDVQLSFRRERITHWRINLACHSRWPLTPDCSVIPFWTSFNLILSNCTVKRCAPVPRASTPIDPAIGCRILRDRKVEAVPARRSS